MVDVFPKLGNAMVTMIVVKVHGMKRIKIAQMKMVEEFVMANIYSKYAMIKFAVIKAHSPFKFVKGTIEP